MCIHISSGRQCSAGIASVSDIRRVSAEATADSSSLQSMYRHTAVTNANSIGNTTSESSWAPAGGRATGRCCRRKASAQPALGVPFCRVEPAGGTLMPNIPRPLGDGGVSAYRNEKGDVHHGAFPPAVGRRGLRTSPRRSFAATAANETADRGRQPLRPTQPDSPLDSRASHPQHHPRRCAAVVRRRASDAGGLQIVRCQFFR